MPSVMNANGTVQAASPDVGSAPGSVGSSALSGQSEVLKQVLGVIDKKARNMEKKKVSIFNSSFVPEVSRQHDATSMLCKER